MRRGGYSSEISGEFEYFRSIRQVVFPIVQCCGVQVEFSLPPLPAGKVAVIQVVADAVASRFPKNRKMALKKMARLGAEMTGVEMALFELLKTAEHEKFREIVKIIK